MIEEIRKLKKAVHGGDVWSRDVELDFSSNVNPLGPSEGVKGALSAGIEKIQHYPDIDAVQLQSALSEYVGVEPENITPGNGSTELIKNFCEVFVRGGNVIVPAPTFSEYEVHSALYGAELRRMPLEPEKMIEAIDGDTGAVFLCNPNNPTGSLFDRKEILAVVEAALDASAVVLLDEAYIEFSDGESFGSQVCEFENLFVLRSLTKFFSLAGLRIGYGVANERLIACMEGVRVPWNVNTLAQLAGIAALEDKAFIETSKDFIKTEREFLFRELSKFLKVERPHANFFLIDLEGKIKAPELKERLLEKGMLIRDCSTFTGLDDNFIRVCIRKREENVRLIEELKFLGFTMKGKSDMRVKPYSASGVWPDKTLPENDCKYYPCHFPGHDCTFCFCPFYPCLDDLTGGRYVVSKRTGRDVWSCKRCGWIHETGVATGILPELEKIPKDDMKALLELRLKFL